MINIEHGFVEAQCENLLGAEVYLNFPSAGATQHIMTTACLAQGVTTIHNAAVEPEIIELAAFLNKMGAKVHGAGTTTVHVEGVKGLKGTTFTLAPDRMEAGTFAVSAVATQGDVRIENVRPMDVEAFVLKLREVGAVVETRGHSMRVRCNARPMATDIMTMPHPGFPTDLQQPFAAMLSIADGTSVVTENVYERRFRYANELVRMGADIRQEGRSAIIRGVPRLMGAQITASDLRAGAALICAALVAEGQSEISGLEHIERGYENMMHKLKGLGAQIDNMPQEKKETVCVQPGA
jgi:UDP-N-acetylglucosamine 1-carboxyvinyltransferase